MCDWGHRAEALECQYAAIHWCERNKKVVGVHTHTHIYIHIYIYIYSTHFFCSQAWQLYRHRYSFGVNASSRTTTVLSFISFSLFSSATYKMGAEDIRGSLACVCLCVCV